MLALIPLVLLVATICGAFYYLLSKRGLAAEERKNPESQRRVSLLTETVAYVGALLLLAGVGVAAGQGWADITAWGHVGIFASIAMFFLAIGLVVLWVADPAIQRMIGVVWFLSAGCAGAAAGIAAHDVYGASPAVTALLDRPHASRSTRPFSGSSAARELQLVALFAGLTITVSAAIVTLTGTSCSVDRLRTRPVGARHRLGDRRLAVSAAARDDRAAGHRDRPARSELRRLGPSLGLRDRHRDGGDGHGGQHPAAEHAPAHCRDARALRLHHGGGGTRFPRLARTPGDAGHLRSPAARPGCRHGTGEARREAAGSTESRDGTPHRARPARAAPERARRASRTSRPTARAGPAGERRAGRAGSRRRTSRRQMPSRARASRPSTNHRICTFPRRHRLGP